MNREEIPYYQVAKKALLTWKKELTKEEADNIIIHSSFEEIENKVKAKTSVNNALNGIIDGLLNKHLIDINRKKCYLETLTKKTFYGENNEYFKNIKVTIQKVEDIEDFIISVLSKIHDGWVAYSQKKFFIRDKKYQHLPIELIGWKETKSDLIFAQPIFETLDINIDEKHLEQAYINRVNKFMNENNIEKEEDLEEKINKGEQFYPILKDQKDILKAMKDVQFVRNVIIPQIKYKGIGSDEVGKSNIKQWNQEYSKLETLKMRRDELKKETNKINELEKMIEGMER